MLAFSEDSDFSSGINLYVVEWEVMFPSLSSPISASLEIPLLEEEIY